MPKPSLRILHCITSINPKNGGPIEGIKQLSAINQRYGHVIEVVTVDMPDDPWVKAFPLACHALGPSHLGKWSYSRNLVPWLKANAHRYDVVIVNGIWQYHGLAGIRSAAERG